MILSDKLFFLGQAYTLLSNNKKSSAKTADSSGTNVMKTMIKGSLNGRRSLIQFNRVV